MDRSPVKLRLECDDGRVPPPMISVLQVSLDLAALQRTWCFYGMLLLCELIRFFSPFS